MKKEAVANVGEEELARATRTTLTRAEAQAEADALFGGNAAKVRKGNAEYLKRLFKQAPAGQHDTSPNVDMAKTASVAPSVDAFFEKLAEPTEAQRRYPELMKVAKATMRKVPESSLKDPPGATPVKSNLSGGSA